MNRENNIPNPLRKCSLYPIEHIARGFYRGGADDDDFDSAILPFQVTDELTIEDVSNLIARDEFEIHRAGLGTYSHERLGKFKYALVHRFPQYEIDETNRIAAFETEMVERSRNLVRSAAACLRLIRPATQHLHFFEGNINDGGKFCHVGFDAPVDTVMNPISHRTLGFRTEDADNLRIYFPLFLTGMAGQYWKFRMAVQMHESGCFQNNDWRAKFFLWTTAIESLFTTQSQRGENSGSFVAAERIKFFLGPKTSIYPPGELSSVYTNPNLSVEDVLGELYCLRNHIAHGDRVPPYYFQQPGRQNILDGSISKFDMLLEATSFVIRHSLLKILRGNLLDKFADAAASDAYFGAQGLTKAMLKKARIPHFQCP